MSYILYWCLNDNFETKDLELAKKHLKKEPTHNIQKTREYK